MVLFPAPAGPSMAIMIVLRRSLCDRAFLVWNYQYGTPVPERTTMCRMAYDFDLGYAA